MTYRLLTDKKRAQDFYDRLPDNSRAIVKKHLLRLTVDPYPDNGADKEQLTICGEDIYFRFHIGKTLTAFYTIHDTEGEVHILEIMTIEHAHKKYGRLGSRR